MKKRISHLFRLNKLFEKIREHKTADEAYREVDSEDQLHVGNAAEQYIASLLNSLPEVISTVISSHNNRQDRSGIDITVRLHAYTPYTIKEVYVQVKNSHKGLVKFRGKLRKLFLNSSFNEVLLQQRLIILIRKQADAIIVESFYNQLSAINEYYAQ